MESKDIAGRHKGDTILVLGGGPSINTVDPEVIKSYLTIGTNSGNLIGFDPDYQLATDSVDVHKADSHFHRSSAHKFWLHPITFCKNQTQEFRDGVVKINDALEKQTCFQAYRYRKDGYLSKNWTEAVFSDDFDKGLRVGRTVMFAAMNLAFLFGVSEIIILGVDLHKNDHFYPPQTPGQVEDLKMDTFPWKHEIIEGFERVAMFMRDKRVRVYNANASSAVKSFPYKKLEMNNV